VGVCVRVCGCACVGVGLRVCVGVSACVCGSGRVSVPVCVLVGAHALVFECWRAYVGVTYACFRVGACVSACVCVFDRDYV